MYEFTCINKIRNSSNIIEKYMLVNLHSGEEIVVDHDILKAKLSNRSVLVNNLKLSSDGRIIDNVEHIDASPAVNKMAFKYTTDGLLNTIYRAKNSMEQSRNEYIMRKSRSSRVGNAILLALKIGASYSAAQA